MAGPALAGILLALGTPGWAIAADALTFGASALFLLRLQAPPVRIAEVTSFLAELRDGWTEFASRSWLWVAVGSAAITNAIFFPAFQVLGPTVANSSLGGSSAWALIAGCFGAGAVLGGLLALSFRPRRPMLVGEGVLILFALPVALLAGPSPVLLIALGALITGAGLSLAEVLYETVAATLIPQESLSRVTAYDWFGSLALEPLGMALIGPLAMGLGTSPTLWAAAGILVACQLVVLTFPSVRRLELPELLPGAPAVVVPVRPIDPGD